MLVEIKRWDNGAVIHSIEADSIRKAAELLIASSADLRYADLRYADLRYANLGFADLRYANLGSANLGSADLRSADLRYADLSSANLRSANLGSADLRYADLRYADLSSADLSFADLRYANLGSANLGSVKNDLWAVLCMQPLEVAGLRAALVAGKINGSTYEGDCACLVGTIANVAHCRYDALPHLKPDSSRPIEVFFCAIHKCDTPETNQCSKIVLEWIDEWADCIFGALEPKPKAVMTESKQEEINGN